MVGGFCFLLGDISVGFLTVGYSGGDDDITLYLVLCGERVLWILDSIY
jgi:hypothetical protein